MHRNIAEKYKVQRYTAEVYDENEIQQLLNAIRDTDMELPLMIDINLGLRMSDAYTDMVAIISQRREEIRELENDIDEIYTEIQNIIPN